MAFMGTWHDNTFKAGNATAPSFVVVPFTGVAVYAFCILANDLNGGGPGTHLSFFIDDQSVGNFTHNPDSTAASYEYHQLVYSNESLSNAPHNLRLEQTGTQNSIMLFDYVIYTSTSSDTATSSSSGQSASAATGAQASSIAGASNSTNSARDTNKPGTGVAVPLVGAIAGIAVAVVAVLAWLLLRKKQRAPAVEQARPALKLQPSLADSPSAPQFQIDPFLSPTDGTREMTSPNTPVTVFASATLHSSDGPSLPVSPSGKGVYMNARLRSLRQHIDEMEASETTGASASGGRGRSDDLIRAQLERLQEEVRQIRAIQDGSGSLGGEAPPTYSSDHGT